MESYVSYNRNGKDFQVVLNDDEVLIFRNCSLSQENDIRDLCNSTDKGLLRKIIMDTYPDALYENKYME